MFRFKVVIVLIFSIAQITSLFSEEIVEIDDIRPPGFPAFILLGVEPSSVVQNVTPEAITVGVLSNVEGNFIPKYGVQISPYWFKEHRELKFSNYYNASFIQTIERTFSISIATASIKLKEEVEGEKVEVSKTGFSIGLSVNIIGGRVSSELGDTYKYFDDLMEYENGKLSEEKQKPIEDKFLPVELHNKVQELTTILYDIGQKEYKKQEEENELIELESRKEMMSYLEEYIKGIDLTKLEIDLTKLENDFRDKNKAIEELEGDIDDLYAIREIVSNKILELIKEIKDINDKRKKGFIWEVAGGFASYPRFFEYDKRNNILGLWMCPSYQFEEGIVDQLYFPIRFIWDGDGEYIEAFGDNFLSFFDAGGGIKFNPEKWKISSDVTFRYINASSADDKIAVWISSHFEHPLSSGLSFLGDFGTKIYKQDGNYKTDFTYGISLGFGFGKPSFTM